MHADTSDIDKKTHAAYRGHDTVRLVWAKHQAALLAARDELVAVRHSALNPSGAVELQRLIEALDRNAAIYR